MKRQHEEEIEEGRAGGGGVKTMLLLLLTVFVAVIAWQIGEKLSSDAISMGLGVLFGMLAGMPAAVLVLAGERRRERHAPDAKASHLTMQGHYPPYGAQPPVIVLTGHGMAPPQQSHPNASQGFQDGAHGWHEPRPTERHFKVVGETEEWIDEW
jgi:hypothetical protein